MFEIASQLENACSFLLPKYPLSKDSTKAHSYEDNRILQQYQECHRKELTSRIHDIELNIFQMETSNKTLTSFKRKRVNFKITSICTSMNPEETQDAHTGVQAPATQGASAWQYFRDCMGRDPFKSLNSPTERHHAW